MSATAEQAKTAGSQLLPPEEQFWKRYSPHNEAPLSLTGSLALHALVIGGLVLGGIYLASIMFKAERKIPVEAVRLPPGGGGDKAAQTQDKGGGGGGGKAKAPDAPKEAGDDEENLPGVDKIERRQALTDVEHKDVVVKFDPKDVEFIEASDTGKALARLEGVLQDKLRLATGGAGAKGDGGTGDGGGTGTGSGKGKGAGTGDGKATLTQREKRMLRWNMKFTATTGPEYVAQLRALGAILAIPVVDGAEPEFRLIRDLRAPAKLLNEDISKIQRIYWIDDKPRSVKDVLDALGVFPPGGMPSRFVAFMPEELENDLFKMERHYVEKVLKRRFDEDRIIETHFRVVPTAKGYRPELNTVLMK